ncbi:MAG: heavy metal-binding domain-containing protein [Flavobacterium sp.]
MKNIFFSAVIMALVMVSCNQKNKEAETTPPMMDDNSTMMQKDSIIMGEKSKMYACPMHPEVQGKMDEKCPKCGMDLTEPVPETPVSDK